MITKRIGAMRRALLPCLLALCMAAGTLLFPGAVSAAQGAGETVLFDIHYDGAGGMVTPVNLPGKVDPDTGGQIISPSAAFNYQADGNGIDSLGKELVLSVRITPHDKTSKRLFQGFIPAGGSNRELIWFKESEAGFMADDRNKEKGNTFSYEAGHTYRCTLTMNLVSGLAAASALDETENKTVFQKDNLIVPEIFPFLPRIKVSFEGAESSSTVLHEMKLVQRKPAEQGTFRQIANVYYDPDKGAMMPEDSALFNYENCPDAKINADAGGLEMFVWGNESDGGAGQGQGKSFYCRMPDGGAETRDKTVFIDFCMSTPDYGTNRKLSAVHEGGTTVLFESNPSGECKFFTKTVGKPDNNKKLNIRFQLELSTGKAKASLIDMTSKKIVFEPKEYDIGFRELKELRMELSPKQKDGKKVTILHSISVWQMEKNGITLRPYAVGMPPYTAGDTAELRLERTGAAPAQVTAYCDGTNLGTQTEGYRWQTPVLTPGTHSFYVNAIYDSGEILTDAVQVTAKKYEVKAAFMDSACESDADMKNGLSGASGGTSPGKGKITYEPMPGTTGQGNAVKLVPSGKDMPADGKIDDYNQNFNMSIHAEKKDGALIVWENDLMLTSAPWTEGTDVSGAAGVEIKIIREGKETAEDLPAGQFFKARKDGNLSFAGTGLTVPYEPGVLYHLKFQINMETGKYNVVVSDPSGPVFSGYNLTLDDLSKGGIAAVTRFKYQQNAVPGRSDIGSYVDNVKIYTQDEAGSYINALEVRKGGTAVYDLSQVRAGDVLTLRASLKNNAGAEAAVPTVIFAVLDQDGGLLDVVRAAGTAAVPDGVESELVTAELTARADFTQGTRIKAFVWDGMERMEPLAEARTY